MSFLNEILGSASGIEELFEKRNNTNNYDKYNKKYIKTVTFLKSKNQAIQEVLKQDKFQALSKKLVELKSQIKER